MNIGIDARAAKWYRGTGIGTYTYELIKSLNSVDNYNNYTLYMPKDNNYINFCKNFSIKNVCDNKKDNFWDDINTPNEIFNDNLSIYHIPQNGIGLPKQKNCPFVVTLHDIIPCKMPSTVSDQYLDIFSKKIQEIIDYSDAIITVSNYSKKDIVETLNYPEEKIHVTYLASEDIYRPLNKIYCKEFIKNNYGIEEDFILYIGGFSPRKNISGLIEAFSKLKCNNNLKLIIGGKKGKSYDMYKQKSIDLHIENKVIFTGFIPIEHLPLFYNAAKLFVYPSLYEGFGLPPIEAMACGTPVIASNRTSIPEILGRAAYMINPEDIGCLCDSMVELLNNEDLRKDLIFKGYDKSRSLSWKSTAKQTLDLYKLIKKEFS
ncbi:glycosyltransferase family 4 protein [Haloimpatiens lingqiaonensis]|uniref:glycosyltransferase family 4 protein n=1 Tax=Haloimpatiens lingqiaonensis TaxID=1380675 RepID=UPI0010FE0A26|nr:glycosyltransferase family 1 protein [Haloimpatiens lingqiaonensis]